MPPAPAGGDSLLSGTLRGLFPDWGLLFLRRRVSPDRLKLPVQFLAEELGADGGNKLRELRGIWESL